MGGGGAASGPHRQRTARGPACPHVWVGEHLVDVALHRGRRREPPLRRKCQLRAEELDDAVAVFRRTVEQRPYEFLSGIDLCPLRVAWRHFSNAERVPASSGLLPSRALRPALSPARRAADE